MKALFKALAASALVLSAAALADDGGAAFRVFYTCTYHAPSFAEADYFGNVARCKAKLQDAGVELLDFVS